MPDGGGAAVAADGRSAALQLMRDKEEVEWQMSLQSAELRREGVDMSAPLVDADGFPRADVDVYAVRHARANIRRLQTDHTRLMRALEAALCQLHGGGGATPPAAAVRHPEEEAAPFLQVGSVLDDSPAESAGLRVGDLLCRLGSTDAANYRGLAELGRMVQHSVQRPLRLLVLRADTAPSSTAAVVGRRSVQLTLVPQPWRGGGLLGCSLLPLEQPER